MSQTIEEKEAFHRAAEARIATFKYEKPASSGKPKDFAPLVRSGLLRVAVQSVHEGGENNLHYHTKSEAAWMVLKGRVRFYGVDDKLLAELGPHEGIFIPGGARYWFEKVGDEDLEILQMVGVENDGYQRINVSATKDWMADQPNLQVFEESATR